MMKAIKNETEIANTYTAYLKDGCAEAEFFGWLFEALENGETLTEWDCSEKIASSVLHRATMSAKALPLSWHTATMLL